MATLYNVLGELFQIVSNLNLFENVLIMMIQKLCMYTCMWQIAKNISYW